MLFSDLYRYANSKTVDAISVRDLADFVEQNHGEVEVVKFYACELDPNISIGHIRLERERTSAYESAFTIASIRYEKDQNRCWRRFICCKELMHVFDAKNERVDTRARFNSFLSEFDAPKLQESPMFASERRALWMALVCIAPERLRNKWKPAYDSGEMTGYEIALKLKVPEICIKALMAQYYDDVLGQLIHQS